MDMARELAFEIEHFTLVLYFQGVGLQLTFHVYNFLEQTNYLSTSNEGLDNCYSATIKQFVLERQGAFRIAPENHDRQTELRVCRITARPADAGAFNARRGFFGGFELLNSTTTMILALPLHLTTTKGASTLSFSNTHYIWLYECSVLFNLAGKHKQGASA